MVGHAQAANWSEDRFIDLTGLLTAGEGLPAPAPGRDQYADDFHNSVTRTERDLILSALTQAGGNKARAARILKIQRSVLYKKMARLKMR